MSGAAKDRAAGDPHIDDARAAVDEFARRLQWRDLVSDIDESVVLNLAGAAAIRAGLSKDLDLLSQSPLVVRAADRR